MLPKAARPRLLDTSQLASYHEAYVVVVTSFLVEGPNQQFKIHQIKSYGVLAKIAKFVAIPNGKQI